MKLCMLCACLIAMLLFSAAAFAELLPWGEGRTSGSASASASHGNPYDPDDDSSDNGKYTTVAGWFSYNYHGYADIETYVNPYDGAWGRSVAYAEADAGPASAGLSDDSGDYSGDETYRYDPPADEPEDYDDYKEFAAYTGVLASWTVIAYAAIEEGSYTNASAWASAEASANMQ